MRALIGFVVKKYVFLIVFCYRNFVNVDAESSTSIFKIPNLFRNNQIPRGNGPMLERLTSSDLLGMNVTNSIALDIGGSLAKAIFINQSSYAESQSDHKDPKEKETKQKANGQFFWHRPSQWSHLTKNAVGKEDTELSVYIPELNGTVHFFTFETRSIKDCINYIGKCRSAHPSIFGDMPGQPFTPVILRATGGGSYKFAKDFANVGIQLDRREEMACVANGVSFLLQHVQEEVFAVSSGVTSSRAEKSEVLNFQKIYKPKEANPFPYLLVNIGSGVSIILVQGQGKYKRVSGSSLGGATFVGLASLLTSCSSFDEVIQLAQFGDISKVDMLVGDIYSDEVQSLGLSKDIIASSFGKAVLIPVTKGILGELWSSALVALEGTLYLWLLFLAKIPFIWQLFTNNKTGVSFHQHLVWRGAKILLSCGRAGRLSQPFQLGAADVAVSLLRMMCNNIGQIAFLNAKIYGLKKIYFGGNFIRRNNFTTATISSAVNFWSNGDMEALFLNHEGFAGALGAHLCGTPFSLKLSGQLFSLNEQESEMKPE